MHTQNVLSKCTPKNVLSKYTLRMCYPSARSTRVPSCPLHNLVHHYVISCTIVYHRAPLVYHRAPFRNLVHPSQASSTVMAPSELLLVYHRAPLHNLVHHRAPLRNLVHPSQASSTVVALPAAWPSDPPLKKLPQLACTTQILIIATVNIVEILS